MNPSDFRAPGAGRVVQAPGGYAAFIPAPLPPDLAYDSSLVLALSRADAALSELSGRQASRLTDLREAYRGRLSRKPNALRLLDELFVNPYLTASRAAQVLSTSRPTARQAIGLLQGEGLLEEVTGRSWRRIYLARPILEVIEERA